MYLPMAVVKIDAQYIIFCIILRKILSVSVLIVYTVFRIMLTSNQLWRTTRLLPFCELSNDSEASMNILEHLEVGRDSEGRESYSLLCHSLYPLQGMSGPPLVNYIAERGLEEVKFCLSPYKFFIIL